MYRLIRPILFSLDAERSHDLVLSMLSLMSRSGPALWLIERFGASRNPRIPCTIAGLELANPVGLAAGLDKDARAFPALAAMGFGCVELGTVTPRPQPGNPGKRMFRVTGDGALVNRMGFNSGGLDQFRSNIDRLHKYCRSIIGANIGKNADTPIEGAVDDYGEALEGIYPVADYVAVNVSSPNTRSLRELQNAEHLDRLVGTLSERRERLAALHGKELPLFLKIAPDLTTEEISFIARTVNAHRLEGVIATNTTIQRPFGQHSAYAERGGLSGRPLRELSTATIRSLRENLRADSAIIGVGGIESAQDVVEKVIAGARVVQIYSSLIYEGPRVIRKILLGLEQRMHSMHINNWSSFEAKLRT